MSSHVPHVYTQVYLIRKFVSFLIPPELRIKAQLIDPSNVCIKDISWYNITQAYS